MFVFWAHLTHIKSSLSEFYNTSIFWFIGSNIPKYRGKNTKKKLKKTHFHKVVMISFLP